jgi:3-oxoacyl-[acyl-carrier protein] reductase
MTSERVAHSARTALVVGGSRGIGAAVVAGLLREGCRVASLSRSGTGPAGSVGVAADLTDFGSMAAVLQRLAVELGAPDILVIAAGAMAVRPLLMTEDELFEQMLAVNVLGPERVISAVAPGMAERGFGRVVVLSSLSGLLGAAGQVAYAAAKAALVGLATGNAAAYAGRGVTVNVVVPGFVETEMTAALPAPVKAALSAASPRGRPVSCEEVAAAVCFLAKPEASAVTGTVLLAEAGQWASGLAPTGLAPTGLPAAGEDRGLNQHGLPQPLTTRARSHAD